MDNDTRSDLYKEYRKESDELLNRIMTLWAMMKEEEDESINYKVLLLLKYKNEQRMRAVNGKIDQLFI